MIFDAFGPFFFFAALLDADTAAVDDKAKVIAMMMPVLENFIVLIFYEQLTLATDTSTTNAQLNDMVHAACSFDNTFL